MRKTPEAKVIHFGSPCMTERLDQILIKLGIAGINSRKQFIDKSTIRILPKNTNLLVEGKRNSSEYMLISGVMHRYNINDEGEMVTSGFYVEASVCTPHFARTYQGKSIFSIQTLTECVLAEIPVKELNQLRSENAEFQRFGQQVVEAELVQIFFTETLFRSYDAKERLHYFRQRYQNLENLIPHHIIASYLGITHVSFSRLRGDMLRKSDDFIK
jgi:CRP-like cAMP-binding protein